MPPVGTVPPQTNTHPPATRTKIRRQPPCPKPTADIGILSAVQHPLNQLDLCRQAHRIPTAEQIHEVALALPEARRLKVVSITDRAAVVSGLDTEQPRYYLQHSLGFQVHDVRHPHHAHRHGRADIGWKDTAR